MLDEYHEPFMVTAVLYDLPANSTLRFDLLIPIAACHSVQHFSWSWIWRLMNTYVLLNKNIPTNKTSIKNLESKFPAMVRVQAASAFKRIGHPFDEFLKRGGRYDLHLQPLKEVHLYSSGISSPFLTTLGDIKYVYIFSAVALIIIILACVNFMNLSTAQSAIRAKEVGIRKVLGSLRPQLIRQFLIEAMIYSFIATFIALFFVSLLLPLFNLIAGKSLLFLVSLIREFGCWCFCSRLLPVC